MKSMNDAGVVADPASGQTSYTHRLRGLAVTGFTATLAAMVATTLAAALAQAAGVDFEFPDGGETIPLSGFAVVTGFCRGARTRRRVPGPAGARRRAVLAAPARG